jgi:trafficking protein particle complex subunit 4
MTILLTATGTSFLPRFIRYPSSLIKKMICHAGTKFVLLTSLAETSANTVLQKVYEVYADAVMKNPFHTPEMPIRSEGFDTRIAALIGTGHT